MRSQPSLANPATSGCLPSLAVQLSRPGTPGGCARTWGRGGGGVCPGLYLAICLSSPSLMLAGEAGLPEARGGLTHLDLGLLGGRWRRSLDSGCPRLCPQRRRLDSLLVFVSAVSRARRVE